MLMEPYETLYLRGLRAGYKCHQERITTLVVPPVATSENTGFSEEKQLVAVNIDSTHQVNRKISWNPLYLCGLCDLCSLNCAFGVNCDFDVIGCTRWRHFNEHS